MEPYRVDSVMKPLYIYSCSTLFNTISLYLCFINNYRNRPVVIINNPSNILVLSWGHVDSTTMYEIVANQLFHNSICI